VDVGEGDDDHRRRTEDEDEDETIADGKKDCAHRAGGRQASQQAARTCREEQQERT